MIMKNQILTGAILLGAIASASAQVIMSDGFDYANLAAMQTKWGTTAGMSLNTSDGLPSPSGGHDGSATVHSWIGSSFSVTPTDSAPLLLSGDIWYSGANNQRNTIGLRNGANPLFEVGFYNSVNNGLGMRVVAFGGNESWVQGLSYVELGTTPQWIRIQATFTSSSVTVKYDLGADGSVDKTLTSTGAAISNPFVDLRFGGPSGLSSAGGAFNVDNISLAVVPVPEPSTVILGLLGGLGLLFVRRRSA